MKKHTVVVCAYHNLGYRCLEELIRQDAEVALVFTHDDAPSEEIWFSSVRELAQQQGIPVVTSDINLRENVELLQEVGPDFLFSFYYRHLMRQEVLDTVRRGALNLHGSFLPGYRGRVPVNWAVINGERETGATLHHMTVRPNAGDLVDQERVEIAFEDSSFQVLQKVIDAAVTVLARSFPLVLDGTAPRVPMDLSRGSYYGARRPADGEIDWSRSAVEIYNLVRGVTHPFPGAFSHLDGRKLLIWKASPAVGGAEPGRIVSTAPLLVGTGEGLLELVTVQEEEGPEQEGSAYGASLHLAGRSFSRPGAPATRAREATPSLLWQEGRLL